MFDWKEIDTVLLDMDGTLLDLHFDNYFWLKYVPEKYAEKHAIDESQAKQYLTEQTTALRGQLNWYCVDFWSELLGLDIEQLKHDCQHKIAILPFASEFLEALNKRHKRAVLVTNAHRKSLALKMTRTGLSDHFDDLVSAHDYGLPKEDADFWRVLNKEIRFDPQRTLFIDDSISVLNSADRYGIKHLLAISKPDSKLPANVIDKFLYVDNLSSVIPSD